ncbi:MAG: hypothetical protein WBP58_16675 [Chitinophagaceae bacterium]
MRLKNIAFAVVLFLLTVVIVDRFMNYARVTPPILKYYHKEYGALNVPDIEYLKSKEGLYLGKTNYDGRFRENYPKRRQDSTAYRIILVGDSFVEGIDVMSRNHFAVHMENIMSKHLGRKVEVLNFGRGNCTLQPSAYYYVDYIRKEYDADLVLFFTEARDIVEVSDYPSTAYVFNKQTGVLEASRNWQNSGDYQLVQKLEDMKLLGFLNASGWFRLAYRAKAGLGAYGFYPKVFGKFYGEVGTQTYDRDPLNMPISETTKAIYDTLEKVEGPQLWFVLRNFPLESVRLKHYLDSMQYRVIDLADTLDVKTIKGTKDDAYYFKTTGLYGGHWNHLGHKAVGHFLSNRILKEISLKHIDTNISANGK